MGSPGVEFLVGIRDENFRATLAEVVTGIALHHVHPLLLDGTAVGAFEVEQLLVRAIVRARPEERTRAQQQERTMERHARRDARV